jgi:hypothetical protein
MKSDLTMGLDSSYKRFGFAAALLTNQEPVQKALFVSCHREIQAPGYLFHQCYAMSVTKALWLKSTVEHVIGLMWKEEFKTLKGISAFLSVEIPPPVGQFSAGLYMLGGIVLRQLEALNSEYAFIYPAQLRALVPGEVSLGGERRKGNSTFLAKAILEENPEVQLIKENNRWNHDEAEAVLLCVLGANNRGPFSFKMPPYLELDRWDLNYYATKEESSGKSRKRRRKKEAEFF